MPFEIHFGCWGWLWISFGRPWGYPVHGLGPGLARGPPNGLDCTPSRSGALFYQDPGIQVMVKGSNDLLLSGLTINLTTAWFKELSIQNCMI